MHPSIFALKRAYVATRNALDAALTPFGLTAAQLDALVYLYDHGKASQNALRRALGVTSATAARMLAGMESSGLVERETHPDDARANSVRMTGAARVLVERLRDEEEAAFVARVFAGLSTSEQAEVTRLLERVAQNMGDTSGGVYGSGEHR